MKKIGNPTLETESEPDLQNEAVSDDSAPSISLPDDANVLVRWQLIEEVKAYSRDKIIFVTLLGVTAAGFAVFAKTYIFALLLVMITSLLVYVGRRGPRTLDFAITDIGLFLEDDFISLEEVMSFNIIDDPGARARLILKIDKIVDINEIVPIYDVNIEEIEQAMNALEIERDDTLKPNLLDMVAGIL